MMDLTQLRSFAEVAERGTIARAADVLGYTAPAVSQHITKLETELGNTLFDRSGGRLSLSDAGALLLPIALEMLHLEHQGRTTIGQQPLLPHLRIAGIASAILSVLTPRIESLRLEMTLEVQEVEDAEAMRELRLGHVDLVLTQEYQGMALDRDERFVFTPVLSDRLILVLPADLSSSTTVEDLRTMPWLVNGSGTRCALATMQVLASSRIEPLIAGSILDSQTLLALVAAGHGVTILPELLVGSSPPPGVVIAKQDLGVDRTLLAVTRAPLTKPINLLLERLCR